MLLAPVCDITKDVFKGDTAPLPRCYAFRAAPKGQLAPPMCPAVIVVPGGSYNHHAQHEGEAVAERLAQAGLAAFVLHYSLAPTPLKTHLHREPARLVSYVRTHAVALGVDPNRIAVLGFSAGGHLSGISTCRSLQAARLDEVPNAVGLIYPVVSFEHDAQAKCVAAWLGAEPSPQARTEASLETQLNAAFPKTFIVCAGDDNKVLPSHSLRLVQACLAHKVAVEAHIVAQGGHGFGLGHTTDWDWCARFAHWQSL